MSVGYKSRDDMAGNGFTVMSFFVGKDEVNDRICHGDFL